MNGYVMAIQGYPDWAIADTVRNYLRGTVPGQNKKFCPRSPELATTIRALLDPIYDELSKKRRDELYQQEQRKYGVSPRTPTEIKRGPVIDQNVSHMEWLANTRSKKYPVGSTWVARTGCVHGPLGSAQ